MNRSTKFAFSFIWSDFREFYPGFGCNEPIVGYMINSSGQLIMNVGQSMETTNATLVNVTNLESFIYCRPQSCLLFVLLMLGTLWLALKLFEFNKTPYLGSTNREILSDYALPISVVIFSAIGSFLFSVSIGTDSRFSLYKNRPQTFNRELLFDRQSKRNNLNSVSLSLLKWPHLTRSLQDRLWLLVDLDLRFHCFSLWTKIFPPHWLTLLITIWKKVQVIILIC